MRLFSALALAALVVTAVAPPRSAEAADYQNQPTFRTDTLPGCENAQVLAQVEDQFEYGAPRMLEADLQILEFSGMFEKAFIPQVTSDQLPDPQPIARRYCQAEALISDRKQRTVYYVIEYPMGFAGNRGLLSFLVPSPSWRAEGCVLGLDEWRVYGANCQSLRRFPEEARTGYGFISK